MAIRDNTYLDKIMGGVQGDPNPFGYQNQVNNFVIDNEPFNEIPGFNFIDAPIETPFIQKAFKPEFRPFLNNPAVLNPLEKIGSGVTSVIDKTKSGIGKGFDLGKAAIGGIASLVTGIPGIGLLLNAFQETPEQKAMKDFYGSQFGLTDTGQVASGIMAGYNPVSLFGSTGLNQAIDKRIARIQKTLKKRKSDTLEKTLKDLQDLKAKEAAASAAALEAQRRGRRPSAPSGDGGTKDSGGPTGGFSYDAGGRQGFGYGLKNGGLVSLL